MFKLARISLKEIRKCESDIDLDWKNGRENIVHTDKASGHLFLDDSIDDTDFQQICEKYGLATINLNTLRSKCPHSFLPLTKGQGSPQPIISEKNCIERDRKGGRTVLCTDYRERCDLSKKEFGQFSLLNYLKILFHY